MTNTQMQDLAKWYAYRGGMLALIDWLDRGYLTETQFVEKVKDLNFRFLYDNVKKDSGDEP